MSHLRPRPAPSFFWQGLLILLPVVVLASLGLVSLRQDRRLVEQDAQERAHEILVQFRAQLAGLVPVQLSSVEFTALEWETVRGAGNIDALTTAEPSGLGPGGGSSSTNIEALLFAPAALAPSGELVSPRAWPINPSPPAWFAQLSASELRAWQNARRLEASGTNDEFVTQAWQRIIADEPGAEARANAEFAVLRLAAKLDSPQAAIERLCQAQYASGTVQTESGLPLADVAFGSALKRIDGTGASPVLVQALARVVKDAPSVLVPYFIEQMKRALEHGPGNLQQAVFKIEQLWKHEERQRKVLRALLERLGTPVPPVTNLWFDDENSRWLALIHPVKAVTRSVQFDSISTTTNEWFGVRLFEKSIVENAFADALQNSGVVLPKYFTLRAELLNEPLQLGSVAYPSASLPIARIAGTLSQRLKSENSEAEAMPGQPGFALSAYLSNPATLYARQQQRTFWFGGLIMAVTLAAVLGFVRTRRAFLREHQLSSLKSNFVSSVSHELRAPIASVRLMAESLQRGKITEPGKQNEYYAFIVQECRRLSALIANVLDFSRIEQGRKQYEFEQTDVLALAQQTVALMGTSAAERSVQLQAHWPGGSAPAKGNSLHANMDGQAMQQALINLIDNAIKHSPAQAVVSVALQKKEGLLTLSVQDQGTGIPASEHERIFERFYRLGSELRRETQGVGIGLSIVKHIVEAHHGRVHVESELGKGSRFTIELPQT